MFLKQVLLAFIGLAAGGIIAAGVFAFITVIGLMPRLAGRTRTAHRIKLYEDCIVIGGAAGNVIDLFHPGLAGGPFAATLAGLLSGVFVGCLVMSLAETLNAVPIIARRVRLSVGLPYVILGLAVGKCLGSLIYFILGMTSK